MNLHITRVADMLERVDRYLLERGITPAIARISAAHALLVTILLGVRAAGQKQSTGLGQFSGGVDMRQATRAELRALLYHVNRTGRMLDAQYPGIAGIFRLPRSASAAQFLAAAMVIEAKATELEADFVACGMQPSFLTELAGLIDAYRDATALKHDGRILRAGSTADLKAQAAAGVAVARELDVCVRNHFRGNEEALGAWTVARRIARAPRRTAETPAPPTHAMQAEKPTATTLSPAAAATCECPNAIGTAVEKGGGAFPEAAALPVDGEPVDDSGWTRRLAAAPQPGITAQNLRSGTMKSPQSHGPAHPHGERPPILPSDPWMHA